MPYSHLLRGCFEGFLSYAATSTKYELASRSSKVNQFKAAFAGAPHNNIGNQWVDDLTDDQLFLIAS